jgi:outer membrane lipoprotein-sorting protein
MKQMPHRRIPVALTVLCLMALILPSCLVRRRSIQQRGAGVNRPLLTADRQTLLDSIARQYGAVRDINAQVNMVPALGTVEKSKITEYKDILAYIIFKKPNKIRIIGLYPVVRTKAFDMASAGDQFQLYVPSKNRFLVGSSEIRQPSQNKLENLRPQHFIDALLVRPVDPATEKVLLENYTDEDNAFYVLHVVHENGNGQLVLTRTIWFSRDNLMLARQLIFDADGNILTDARYSDWKAFDNVPFPKHVEINRPRDEYAVVIDITKMDINKGVADDKFVMEQPEGTVRQILGQPSTEPPAPTAPPAKGKKTKK